MITWILLGIAAFLAFYAIWTYNSLIRLKNQVENAWAQIDVQLKRRNDLIPNLMETVKGYVKHEKEVLTQVTKARTQVMSAQDPDKKAEASNMLTDSLKSLFAVSENYPNLKANENFLQLQEELSGTENKIAYSRQHYNDMVMKFNTRLQTFPFNIFASTMNFDEKKMFETPEAERQNVKVSF